MEMNKPRVSIGLPIYNGEKYLEETLESITSQTFTDFELIISDNGSSDRTAEICKKFVGRDRRIRYYRNEKNLGVAPNYNRVFELSSGEYFKWADYDDILEYDFLAKCVDGLDNNPRAVVSFPKVRQIDENGQFIRDYESPADTSSPRPEVRFRNLILYPEKAVQAMGLMRSDIVRKTVMHGSYPSSDEVFLAHLALFGDYHEISERLLNVRVHPGNSTAGVLISQRARVLFFDTSLEDKAVLLKWLYLKGCLTAIKDSPLNFNQRLYCYFQLLRWSLIKQNFRSLVKDMLLAINRVVPIFTRLEKGAKEAAKKIYSR